MGHFFLVRDRDPDRRAASIRAAHGRFAVEEGLSPSSVTDTCVAIAYAIGGREPFSSWIREDRTCLLFGFAHDSSGGRLLAAREVVEREGGEVRSPSLYDGFHVALWARSGSVSIVPDRLGLFPVYYGTAGDVLVAGSSPHLFDCHPLFRHQIDPVGLAGTLLTQEPVRDRLLLAGVRRLGQGRALVCAPEPEERVLYRLPDRARDRETDPDHQLRRVEAVLRRALDRHLAPHASFGVLLSGGRDSRLLAGWAMESRSTGSALVIGDGADYEVRCATRVARVLGLPLRSSLPPPEAHAAAACRNARWDPLVSGVSNVHHWAFCEPLSDLPPQSLNGLIAGTIVGGTLFYTRGHPTRSAPFRAVLERGNARGVEQGMLRRLLRPSWRGAVDEALVGLERDWEDAAEAPSERAWRFQLAHTDRFRIGGNAWRTSFGSWPLMPVLDAEVLEVVASVDQDVLAQRQGQDSLLVRTLPALARIPHVALNADPSAPLLASWWKRLAFGIRRRLVPSAGRRGRRRERRYNWRAYDFNGDGWREIRRIAEPHRDSVASLFDMDALRVYLPGPEETPPSRDFFDLMGRQLVVSLILWARHNL